MENRRESLVAFVLFIALLFFCILMALVPLLAGTTARADSITFEQVNATGVTQSGVADQRTVDRSGRYPGRGQV